MNRRIFYISIILSLVCYIFVNPAIAQNPADQTLFQAIAEGNMNQVQAAISGGANVNAKNQLGWTPLQMAVRLNKGEIATLLLQSRANIDDTDSSGKTALILAVESGQVSAVQFLIGSGANVNITDNSGENALSAAQKIGLISISNTLTQSGATMPTGVNSSAPGSQRGMNNMQRGQFPGAPGTRRGVTRGNVTDPGLPAPNETVSIDNPFIQPVMPATTDINLDPNEVKARIQKYDGLEKAVQDVADGSRVGMRQWQRDDTDNRALLITAMRSQYEDELQFIKKIADEEKAKKTSEAADKLLSTRREQLLIAAREVRDQISQQERQNRGTTSSSRRGGRTTASSRSTRGNRRAPTTTIVTQPTTVAQEPENKYDPEIQNEVDTWLNASVENVSGRITLMNSQNNMIMSEISSLKPVAEQENAQKTIAAIDGLLLARQQRYNELQNELNKNNQQSQSTLYTPSTPGSITGPGAGGPATLPEAPVQNVPQRGSAGRRGRF